MLYMSDGSTSLFFLRLFRKKKKEECLKCSVEKENCLGHIVVNLPLLVKCCLRERDGSRILKKRGPPAQLLVNFGCTFLSTHTYQPVLFIFKGKDTLPP